MELKRMLLEALDSPSRVWDAILTNLATEPRMALLVFTTCTTPVSMIKWQEAVAHVSADSAMRFEASLRVLDDSFVKTYKRVSSTRVGRAGSAEGVYFADFRNPSMDDFCASYLDRNVGIAVAVASHEPSGSQIDRLISLGAARMPNSKEPTGPRPKKYPNIYDALIAKPSLLLNRLMDIMPIESGITAEQTGVALSVLNLLSQASQLTDADWNMVRARLVPLFADVAFGYNYDRFLRSALTDSPRLQALINLLGKGFDKLYENLVDSADDLSHFDTLTSVDEAFGRTSEDVSWANYFSRMTSNWLDEDMSSNDIETARMTYERIVWHLELGALEDRTEDWNEKYREAQRTEQRDEEADEDESWSSEPNEKVDLEARQIDAMFDSLKDISK